MGTQSNPSQVVDGVETKLRSKNNKKVIASCLDGMVTSNQVRKDHDITDVQNSHIAPAGDEDKKMPFVGFDVAKLQEQFPSKGVGRGTGKPTVAISDKGRLTFSSMVGKAFDGCAVVLPARDKDNPLRIALTGYSETPKGKENGVWPIIRSKDTKKDGTKAGSKQIAVNFPLILKALNYDYAKAGSHSYEVEKMDAEKHVVMFSLPATLPTPKPKAERKPRKAKVAAVAAGATAGTVATTPTPAPVAAPVASDDEVVVE